MEGKVGITASLVLVVMLLTLGTFTYGFLEKWSFVDSAYFSMTTLATVGYGDMHPTSKISKLFTIFYIIGGASLTLFALSTIASKMMENNLGTKADNFNLRIKKKMQRI